ncbi:MAG: AAA family ATPase, partial [Clostridia bacterium]|nr:AAA family ATPase [Clostridia bacterium]
MIEEKEKTAETTSVGADERQSTSKTNIIVTDSEPESNSKKKNLRELARAMQTYSDPYFLPTVTMNDLFDTVYDGKPPVIENLLYPGLFVFAGAPKIGKSFLMLQIAYHVSTGLPLWEFPVSKSPVLYLALEDSYDRLQRRLYKMFGVEGTDDLYLSIASMQLGKGLDEQITWFLKKVPDTRLIIIDTLQKVREAGGDNFSYANDYEIISALKKIADASKICILVVHHTRKQQADDKFDMISGTNGILGAADGAFLLQKEKRTSNDA